MQVKLWLQLYVHNCGKKIIYLIPLRLHSSKKDPIRSAQRGLRLFTWRFTLLPKSQRKTYKHTPVQLNSRFPLFPFNSISVCTNTSATPLVDTLQTFPLSQTPVLLAAQNISASQCISCGSDLEKRLFSMSWILQTLRAKWQRYNFKCIWWL